MQYPALVSAFCTLALSASAFAQPPSSPPGQENKEKRAPSQVVETGKHDDAVVERDGVKVLIDPQTGRIRQPTAEEAAALSAAIEQQFGKRAEGVTLKFHADGTVQAELDESFMEAITVTRRADGSLKFGHTTGLASASRAVVAAKAPAKSKKATASVKRATPAKKTPILEEKE